MERYGATRAVIIGGTSGMGLATAKMLLDGGATGAATRRRRLVATLKAVREMHRNLI
jgi:NAD(P)-dependent dehydrogenase (short-subunit alcohol dehydrogenase family)